MRGEQCLCRIKPRTISGSPPLARGTGRFPINHGKRIGITPACAGNSTARTRGKTRARDHPRLRGEQFARTRNDNHALGSPPLARGTGHGGDIRQRGYRITPACAGNSFCPSPPPCGRWDHPRLRGEQSIMCCKSSARAGSPPLARGTAYLWVGGHCPPGITPACAGNSSRGLCPRRTTQDHPRLRGEQSDTVKTMSIPAGSPPLARGTAGNLSLTLIQSRITPACAGNRKCGRYKHHKREDHPRLRGEQYRARLKKVAAKGSPPLARGTAAAFSWGVYARRITPACAGNSDMRKPEDFPYWDHPRLRGEQRHIASDKYHWLGSPPLARGTD